jgi:LEA14-like dessication related protein
VKGVEVKTLDLLNPRILEPNRYFMKSWSSLWGIILPLLIFFLTVLYVAHPARAFENPQVELKKVRIIEINPEAVVLEGTLELYNPNDLELRFSGYDYQLSVEKQRLVTGKSVRFFELGAQKRSTILLPAIIRFDDLAALTKKDLFSGDITYLLSGTVHLKSWIGTFDYPFSFEGILNLPDLMREKARELLSRP